MHRTSLQSSDPPSPRPPVVVVLGHIDHGKTTLLDRLRSSRVAEQEAGQITQTLTGSAVATWQGRVTFLDTPGHEAFETMRTRGAASTDLVLLVISAVDGVQEMTRRVAALVREDRLPVVIALTKIDADGANPGKVRKQILELGLVPEELGGDALVREVSALTGQGMEDLVEALALQSMMCDPKAAPDGAGKGYVLDAMLDERLGPRARVLVREGVIRVGDRCQAGNVVGWVRAMFNDQQQAISEALPSMPVDVVGLGAMPSAGADFRVIERARSLEKNDEASGPARPRSAEEWLLWREASAQARLKVVLRAESQGALEALSAAFSEPHEGVVVDVIKGAVGRVTEGDIKLAATAGALVLGLGVKVLRGASEAAYAERVSIYCEDTIYKVIERVKMHAKSLKTASITSNSAGRSGKKKSSQSCGQGDIIQLFDAPGAARIVGVLLWKGEIFQGGEVRITREGRPIGATVATSMQRKKKKIAYLSAMSGEIEFGLGFEEAPELQIGDRLLFFDTQLLQLAAPGFEDLQNASHPQQPRPARRREHSHRERRQVITRKHRHEHASRCPQFDLPPREKPDPEPRVNGVHQRAAVVALKPGPHRDLVLATAPIEENPVRLPGLPQKPKAGVLGKISGVLRSAVTPRVLVGDREPGGEPDQRAHREPGGLHVPDTDRQIEPIGDEIDRAIPEKNLDLQPLARRLERPETPDQAPPRHHRRERDANEPAALPSAAPQLGLDLVDRCQNRHGVRVEPAPFLRQRHAARGPGEQRRADPLFEGSKAPADEVHRQPQRTRGLAQAPCVNDASEDPQLFDGLDAG